jgi:hypothetical protein
MRCCLLVTCALLALPAAGAAVSADSAQGAVLVSVQVERSCTVTTGTGGAAVNCGTSPLRTLRVQSPAASDPAPATSVGSDAQGSPQTVTINF